METGCPLNVRPSNDRPNDRGSSTSGPVRSKTGRPVRGSRDATLYFSARHISSRFGARLRELRRERRLTQVRMSVDYGIDRSYLSDIERGRKSISLPFLEVIALGMQISMSELVKDL